MRTMHFFKLGNHWNLKQIFKSHPKIEGKLMPLGIVCCNDKEVVRTSGTRQTRAMLLNQQYLTDVRG